MLLGLCTSMAQASRRRFLSLFAGISLVSPACLDSPPWPELLTHAPRVPGCRCLMPPPPRPACHLLPLLAHHMPASRPRACCPPPSLLLAHMPLPLPVPAHYTPPSPPLVHKLSQNHPLLHRLPPHSYLVSHPPAPSLILSWRTRPLPASCWLRCWRGSSAAIHGHRPLWSCVACSWVSHSRHCGHSLQQQLRTSRCLHLRRLRRSPPRLSQLRLLALHLLRWAGSCICCPC